jgi:hypothetical protein
MRMKNHWNRRQVDKERELAISALDEIKGEVWLKGAILDYIYLLERERAERPERAPIMYPPLCQPSAQPSNLRPPDSQSKESFMQGCDRILKAIAPPREQRGVGVVKNLTQPPRALGPRSVEVDGKPEPTLDAPGVQGGDLVSGLEGNESRGGHGPPEERKLSLQYAIGVIEKVRGEFERECEKDYLQARAVLAENDFRTLADWHERTRVDAVKVVCFEICKMLRS